MTTEKKVETKEVVQEVESKPVIKKKTTAKKTEKDAENKTEIKEEKEKVEKPKKIEKPIEREKAVQIDHSDLIAVRSVTKGGLTYISKRNGLIVSWDDFGAEEYMEFGELVTMKSSKPKFLTEPYIVVDDEDVIERLNLKSIYEDMIDLDNLEGFYKQSVSEIEAQLEKMPKGIKKLVVDTARSMIQAGTLYDIRKIKLLEDKLKVGLQISMN